MIAPAPSPALPALSEEEADLLHALLCAGGSVPQFLQTAKLHLADVLAWSARPAVRAHLDLYEQLLGTLARLSALAQLPRAYEALGRVAASDDLVEARRAAVALLVQRRVPTARSRAAADPTDTHHQDAPDRPTNPAPRPRTGRASVQRPITTPAPHADHLHHNGAPHPDPTDEARAPEATQTEPSPEPAEPAATDLIPDGRTSPLNTSNDAEPSSPPRNGEPRARDRPTEQQPSRGTGG